MKTLIGVSIYFAIMIALALSVSSCQSKQYAASQRTKCGTHAAKVKMAHYNSLQYR